MTADAPQAVTLGAIGWRLLGVLVLVLANGFFVAAEYSLVGSRRSRIDHMVNEGHRGARRVQAMLGRLDYYISSTQFGITLASLAIGWLGEDALTVLFDTVLRAVGLAAPSAATHTVAAIVIAYLVLTFFHIIVGEQTPKSMAIVGAEKLAILLSRPLQLFAMVMLPFIWALNAANNAVLRLLKIPSVRERRQSHSPEELRLLVMQARAHGTLNESDTAMLAGVFDFHDKRARDVMRPRTEVVALAIDDSEAEVWRVLRAERYSRYPVYKDTLDDVVGVFLAKDLWLHERVMGEDASFSLAPFVREALYVPDSRRAERVLDDLRRSRAQMAVVLDEYGGTAGIITMEDLVEEVIGDIADEYDALSRTSLEMNGVLELAGTLSLIDVRSDHRLAIPEGDWTTLGGFVFAKLGRLPKIGDRVGFPGGELEVVAMDGRRVAAVRVHPRPRDERGAA